MVGISVRLLGLSLSFLSMSFLPLSVLSLNGLVGGEETAPGVFFRPPCSSVVLAATSVSGYVMRSGDREPSC